MNDRNNSRTVFAIGECMVELSHSGGDDYRRSFAGDVYNTAVYLRRLAPADCNVEFVSAIGDDVLSQKMMNAWRNEDISTTHVTVLPDKTPGLYLIGTDEKGERRFSYWRSQSAARELTTALERIDTDTVRQGDYIYFSGVTIAILTEKHRALFFDFIKRAKSRGASIAFDPNFRPVLWESHAAAAASIMKAYGLSDIVLTGAEEEALLFERGPEVSELDELERIGIREAILKAGERGVFGANDGMRFHIPFTPAEIVVDTTAAGDAFAGAYLACRLRTKTPGEAAALATRVARIVVSSRGAVIDRRQFQSKMRKDPSLSNVFGGFNVTSDDSA